MITERTLQRRMGASCRRIQRTRALILDGEKDEGGYLAGFAMTG
jgi:hypothetical protein